MRQTFERGLPVIGQHTGSIAASSIMEPLIQAMLKEVHRSGSKGDGENSVRTLRELINFQPRHQTHQSYSVRPGYSAEEIAREIVRINFVNLLMPGECIFPTSTGLYVRIALVERLRHNMSINDIVHLVGRYFTLKYAGCSREAPFIEYYCITDVANMLKAMTIIDSIAKKSVGKCNYSIKKIDMIGTKIRSIWRVGRDLYQIKLNYSTIIRASFLIDYVRDELGYEIVSSTMGPHNDVISFTIRSTEEPTFPEKTIERIEFTNTIAASKHTDDHKIDDCGLDPESYRSDHIIAGDKGVNSEYALNILGAMIDICDQWDKIPGLDATQLLTFILSPCITSARAPGSGAANNSKNSPLDELYKFARRSLTNQAVEGVTGVVSPEISELLGILLVD